DAVSFEQPSVIIDNARLTLSYSTELAPLDPTITCNHALIGGSGAARMDVIENAKCLAHGSLRVGGPGEGRLSIESGGDLTSAESRIGGPAGGHATVGSGGSWTTGNLAIGIDNGSGEMIIQDGGQVTSGDLAVIGQEPGLGNSVLVRGRSEAGNSVVR